MEGQSFKPIAILGAGSWGSAIALYLGRRGQTVNLWSIEKSEIDAILADHANHRYLPDQAFPDTIKATTDLAQAVKDVDDVLMVVPSVGFRSTLEAAKPYIKPNTRIICASKGMDSNTGQLFGDIVAEIFGEHHPFAVLSGPSFAKEVAAGLPAALVIASKDKEIVNTLTQRFNSPIFRIYPSDDVIGVEIGGVAKNVIAIATGISDGMELGSNARSALITRGLAEIIRLGLALGAKMETMIGLSGMGDLILTCSDNQSRNRRLGLALGKGHDIQAAEKEIGQVVEGKRNAELVAQMAKRYQVEMPITNVIWDILQGKINTKDGMQVLLSRSTKQEA